MKRRQCSLIVAMALVVSMTFGVGVVPAKSVISKAKAKKIVLKDKKFKARSIKKYMIKRDGREYEIDFVKGRFKYEFELNAYTGKIKDRDIDRVSISKKDAKKKISKSKAKKIALKQRGFNKNQVKYLKAEKDKDKGFYTYDVSFKKGMYEYECEIDYYTGKILDSNKEYDD